MNKWKERYQNALVIFIFVFTVLTFGWLSLGEYIMFGIGIVTLFGYIYVYLKAHKDEIEKRKKVSQDFRDLYFSVPKHPLYWIFIMFDLLCIVAIILIGATFGMSAEAMFIIISMVMYLSAFMLFEWIEQNILQPKGFSFDSKRPDKRIVKLDKDKHCYNCVYMVEQFGTIRNDEGLFDRVLDDVICTHPDKDKLLKSECEYFDNTIKEGDTTNEK